MQNIENSVDMQMWRSVLQRGLFGSMKHIHFIAEEK